MRILMLTQWFEPEPTFKGLLFAKELQRQGHDVEVLTGFPNYPAAVSIPGHPIRPWQREVVDGVSVTRVALYPSHDNSGVRRALNYLSFAGTATLAIPFLRRPDVVYVTTLPPPWRCPRWFCEPCAECRSCTTSRTSGLTPSRRPGWSTARRRWGWSAA